MDILDFMKSIASSLSYVLVVSGFVVGMGASGGGGGDDGGNVWSVRAKRQRWGKFLIYFAVILAIDIIFTIFEWEVYANYIFLAIISVFIGRNKTYGYLKGFNFALTIFVAFMWAIVFVGSIAFLLLPQEAFIDSFVLIGILSLTHLATAALLRLLRNHIFRMDMSNKLLIIDAGAKIFFVVFFNLFLPRYFGMLGMEHYATLTLVLLTIAIIFAVYRQYSISLEKKIAVHNSNLLAVMQWA